MVEPYGSQKKNKLLWIEHSQTSCEKVTFQTTYYTFKNILKKQGLELHKIELNKNSGSMLEAVSKS